ncbi:MAG: hypothetical protein PHT01_05375, partial [Spirochaetales bacterium]|nr:hypothetical protein [Spirochaetales bacterium]
MKKSSPGPLLLILLATALTASSCSERKPLNSQEIRFVVEKGSSANSVSAALRQAGLVRSKALFLALMKIKGLEDDIKAGTYRIPAGTS